MHRLAAALAALGAAGLLAGTGASARPAPASAQPAHHLVAAAPACRRGYYKNAYGTCVQSPGSDPSGATARCADGTYSYSQHASGTCSHHGGVARWIHHP